MSRDTSGIGLSETPLLVPAAGLAGGIAVCGAADPVIAGICLLLVVAGVVFAVWRVWPRMAFAFVGMGLGMALWMVTLSADVATGKIETFRGRLSAVYDYGSSQRVVAEVGRDVRIGVTVYDFPYLLEIGDSVEVRGLLLSPVTGVTVPDESDGAAFARIHRLSAVCVADEGDVCLTASASGIRGWLNRMRGYMLDAVRHSGLSQGAASFMAAVLLGEGDVDPDVRENFSRAGLSHVLALSGTHVSTIVFLLAILLLPVEMAGNRKVRMGVTLAALWTYAMLTGMSPSVVRAVMMASFLIVGKLSGRHSNSLNSLFGAAVLILLFQPSALFMPGFQLSFVAVAGILLFVPPVMSRFRETRMGRNRVACLVAGAILLPLAAVAATAPLSSWHFHYFPVWLLVANLPVTLLLPLFMAGGAVMLLGGMCGLRSAALAGGLDFIYGVMERVAEWTAGLPGNIDASLFYFPGWILLPIYVGMFMVWRGLCKGLKVYVLNGMALMAVSVCMAVAVSPDCPSEEWYVWRSNRGVAIVCRDGRDVRLLTDAAPKYYPEIALQAESRLRDYLGRRGARLEGVGDSVSGMSVVTAGHGVWIADDCRIAVVKSEDDMAYMAANLRDAGFVVVSRGFKGEIMEVVASFPHSRVVLSPSLPPLRRIRYARELDDEGVDYLLNLPPEASRYSPSTK